ncbi:MAG TPA: 4'-phosphopantetheinyl transferase superfamily protein [Chloroflexota bacterium]|nr:4'-phosphopantetheinyl transferase superfamily protein [Chloroflexota bacterium]
MRIATGIDLARIERIARLSQSPRFLERVFHPTELRDLRPAHLAGLFAAKEAVFKALGERPIWRSVTITSHSTGRPIVALDDRPGRRQICSIDVSISHEGEYAVAAAIVVQATERDDECAPAGR